MIREDLAHLYNYFSLIYTVVLPVSPWCHQVLNPGSSRCSYGFTRYHPGLPECHGYATVSLRFGAGLSRFSPVCPRCSPVWPRCSPVWPRFSPVWPRFSPVWPRFSSVWPRCSHCTVGAPRCGHGSPRFSFGLSRSFGRF